MGSVIGCLGIDKPFDQLEAEPRVREIGALVSRFPRYELAMRRLYARDPTFRTICGDYYEALRALCYWQSEGTSSNDIIEQYRELLNDLESEVSSLIEGASMNGLDRKLG